VSVNVRAAENNLDQAVDAVLAQIFGSSDLSFDLAEGTVRGYKQVRVIYLSEDIIRGVYEALVHETGEAWTLIMKTAGTSWGRRTAKLLDFQIQELSPQGASKLPVSDYFNLLQAYYQLHGWGHADFDLSKARSNGLIRVRFVDSIFVKALSDLSEPVDHMVGGMLTGMFSGVSKVNLDCIEIASPLLGSPHTEFAISSPRRIEEIATLVEERIPAEEICEQLCS